MSLVFAFGVGLFVSYLSYQWITNPDRAAIRAVEEGVVRESRQILESYVGDNQKIEISDPLDRVREAGRVYLFPIDDGWEISGQYRRAGDTSWRPYIMTLDRDARLVTLSVRDIDAALIARAADDPKLTVLPPR